MLSVLKKLAWFFRRYWKRYTFAVGLLVIVGVMEMIPPRLLGIAIDEINQGLLTRDRLYEIIFIYGGLLVAIYIITYFWMYKLFGGAFLIERILRSRMMRHLLKMSPTFFEKNRTGDLMARSTNDLKAISATAGFGVLTLIDSTVFLLTIVVTMSVLISWKLTLMAMLPLPIIALVMSVYGKIIHQRFTVAQAAFGTMNDQVLENISGVRVVRAYVQEKATRERFNDLTEDIYEKNMSVARIDSYFEPTIKVLVGISYLIGLGYGAYLVFHQEITLGDLVSFNIYLGMLIWPMFAIGELINIMQRGNASLDRVNETLVYKADVQDVEQPIELERPEEIAFKNYTFTYPSSKETNLQDITLSIARGDTLGIVGKTGSGKSTLVKQLLREYPLGQGAMTINGISIERMAKEQLSSWMGYVPQEQILFSKTVLENISFGRPDARQEEIDQVVKLAALEQDVEMLPEGLQTLVGEKGVALSGGQKQRVSIARALLVDPEILILDDALSAVDAKTEALIISHIRQLRKNKTTLICTHRLSAVQHADWVIVLEQGKIIEEGTHQQLVQDSRWYKKQHQLQQSEEKLKGAEQ